MAKRKGAIYAKAGRIYPTLYFALLFLILYYPSLLGDGSIKDLAGNASASITSVVTSQSPRIELPQRRRLIFVFVTAVAKKCFIPTAAAKKFFVVMAAAKKIFCRNAGC